MTRSDDQRYTIRAHWKPLVHLNEETTRGARIFFTVALDVVISGINEPMRFLIEGKAFVIRSTKAAEASSQETSESIWSSFKKIPPLIEEFDLNLRQVNRSNGNGQTYEVISLESQTEAERLAKVRRLSSSKECGDVDCKTFVSSVSVPSSTTSNDEEIDESLLVSASGEVSKDCHEDILTNWNEMLIKWRKNYSERPKGLKQLVQQGLLLESFSRPTFSSAGIPQALRCEVWQLLAESIVNEDEMIENIEFS